MKYLSALVLLSACGSDYTPAVNIPGPAGVAGPRGYSVLIEQAEALPDQCPAGGTVIVTATDVNMDGRIGQDDSNYRSTLICNGAPGMAGQDAPLSMYTPVRVITPCGPTSATYKEVLLLLEDGSLLSSFSDNQSGFNTRLAFLPDGSYMDTDGSNCQFNVITNGSTRSVIWAGGHASWNVEE